MTSFWVFIAIGLGAGVLSGLFGIGGGIVIVPTLMYVARMTQLQATGTSLGALLLPVGALGALAYYRTGNLNIATSLWVALGLTLGAWVGAWLAPQLPPVVLRRLFAGLLMVIAVRMWIG